MTDEGALASCAAEYMGRRAPFSRAVYDWFVEGVRLVSLRELASARARACRATMRA